MYTMTPEHEYNFKVKVNYQNGAISIHGPGPIQFMPASASVTPRIQTGTINSGYITSPNHRNLSTINNMVPFSALGNNSNTFLGSNNAQPNHFEPQIANFNKVCSSKYPIYSQIDYQNNNGRQQDGNKNIQRQNQHQINCVICQKKYKNKDFQYHLQLHRNTGKKKILAISHKKLQLSQNDNNNNNSNILKKIQNSFNNENKQDELYSFQNKNNFQNQSHQPIQISYHNSSVYQEQKPIICQSNRLSAIPSCKSNYSGNGKNGFVEIPKQVSQQQTMEVIVTPPLPTNQVKSVEVGVQHLGSVPSNKQSNSGKSSEHPNIIQYPLQQQPNIQNEIQTYGSQMSKTKLPQYPSNQHQLKDHEQSKIYQYFPQPGHYSISQHRVDPILNSNNKKISLRSKLIGEKTITNQNNSVLQRNNHQNQVRSECSESSISNIQSMGQPLQNMSKEQLVKAYHIKKNRVDLSNIIGMSQVLARQKNTNSSVINWNDEASKKVRSQTVCKKQRKIGVSTMLKNQQPFLNKQSSYFRNTLSRNDLELAAVQSRQIYRGTQVNENDIREYDSVLNASKNSKSSAKTKIPRNYLAVSDFISGSSSQANL